MALGKSIWRPVHVNAWDWLESASPLAQRLWLWLWTGPASTSCGLVSMREYQAVGALRTKPVALRAALDELASLGRVVVQDRTRDRVDLYLAGFVTAQCRVKDVQRNGIRDDIERFADGLAKAQAVEDWEVWNLACDEADGSLPRGKRQPEPQKKLNKTNQNQTTSGVPNGTQPVATAPVTGWTFQPHKPKAQDHTLDSQKSEVEQRLSYNEESNPETEANTEQGDSPSFLDGNEDDEVPDWAAAAMAKAAAPSALPSFPGVRNPEVAARLAAAEAERQASLTLTAPKAKPAKTLTPKQLDAIFAREQMAKWVAEWNGDSGMAKVNAPAVMGDVAKLATVLMGHAARLTSTSGALVGPHELLGWAAQHGGYHGGSGAKKWTLKGWLAADHVGEVFAAYRDWCVKQDRTKRWGYHIERTLTDWREEHAEAAEQAQRVKELDDAA